jgi:predicted hotdog family 3-hydroxylacyl-ACP dehydratase
MLKDQIHIDDLIPHRKPMRLITKILYFNDQKAITQSIVSPNWPLTIDQKGTNALILIELVAQTAGINNGWKLLKSEGLAADHRGWIVGIKKAELMVDNLAVGTAIVTTSENQFKFENFREIHGVTMVDDKVVGEITLHLMKAQN